MRLTKGLFVPWWDGAITEKCNSCSKVKMPRAKKYPNHFSSHQFSPLSQTSLFFHLEYLSSPTKKLDSTAIKTPKINLSPCGAQHSNIEVQRYVSNAMMWFWGSLNLCRWCRSRSSDHFTKGGSVDPHTKHDRQDPMLCNTIDKYFWQHQIQKKWSEPRSD